MFSTSTFPINCSYIITQWKFLNTWIGISLFVKKLKSQICCNFENNNAIFYKPICPFLLNGRTPWMSGFLLPTKMMSSPSWERVSSDHCGSSLTTRNKQFYKKISVFCPQSYCKHFFKRYNVVWNLWASLLPLLQCIT